MKKSIFLFAIFIAAAFALTGCGTKNVNDIDDVNIIKGQDTIEDTAVDTGIAPADSGLVDLGDLGEPVPTDMEGTAKDLGVDSSDPGLIELGELI
ncbi:MAG: hypothetical protein HGA85_05970 [Nanoarchaeota archaeon]|nr:hypothetical protein [Nanoarchaeota archaeon]